MWTDELFVGGHYDLPLSLLTPAEYNEMQDLLLSQEDTSEQTEHGEVVYHKANPMNYPARLKKLLKKQERLQFVHLYGSEEFDDMDNIIYKELDI